MAEALLDKVLGGLAVKAGQTVTGAAIEEGKEAGSGAGVDYEVLETYKGKDLEYKEYEPLYQCAADVAAKQHKKGHFVTCDTYVTMSMVQVSFILHLHLVKMMPRLDVSMTFHS